MVAISPKHSEIAVLNSLEGFTCQGFVTAFELLGQSITRSAEVLVSTSLGCKHPYGINGKVAPQTAGDSPVPRLA